MGGGERAGAGRFTLDTNVLVYCVDSAAGPRRETARRVVEAAARRDCRLTLQAVSEFYAAAIRRGTMPRDEAAAQAGDWLDLFPAALAASPGAVRAALAAAAAGRASYWDALLLATAAEGGCVVVLTEDMADGAVLGGVQVVNPFGPDGRLTAAAARLLGPGA